MRVPQVAGFDVGTLLDPDSRAWSSAASEAVQLVGTPVGLQPTEAVRASWANKPIGGVDRVRVSALHDGATLAFRLEWADKTENSRLVDTTHFADAAALLLPSVPNAPMVTMGAPGTPVNAWYWRADEPELARQIVAEGLGSTRAVHSELVRARGVWKDGRWRVVVARALRVDTREPIAQLALGTASGYGVAIWEGSRSERAGIKAFSINWREFELVPAATARR